MNAITPFTDVLVLGGGVAGAYAALHARQLGLHVTLACKGPLTGGSTFWAQGGVAAPVDVPDQDGHARDTLTAGRGLCDPNTVRVFVREAQRHVDALRAIGVPFAADLTLEGGHSRSRIRHAFGDATGRAVSETLARVVRERGVKVLEGAFAQALLLSASGRVVGAEFQVAGRVQRVEAGAVLLATGGFGRVYDVTTAPSEGTGDGVALAYRAGAAVRDLEFVQFHPTVCVSRGEGLLVTEAARGEGGVLRNAHGERFMHRYDPLAELAPRDVVARAIQAERHETGNVTLDLTHLGAAFVRSRFPSIHARLLSEGVDIARQPVPVRPAVHYTIGGVMTDTHGRTTVPGLYAAGEVASSGLHGANRLASNSLSEGLVFGARAVEAAARELLTEPAVRATDAQTLDREGVARTRQVVGHAAGLTRTEGRLREGLTGLPGARTGDDSREALEGGNVVLLATLLLRGALAREESRGAHWREDHPTPAQPYHVVQARGSLERLETAETSLQEC